MKEKNYNTHEYAANFRIEVFDKIKQFLLDTFNRSKEKTINEFALKHRKLTNSVAGFRMGSTCYVHSLENLPAYKCKRLHPTLKDEFTNHLNAWETHTERQTLVDNVIKTALNMMGNTKDLRELLPNCIHSVLPPLDSSETSLSRDKVSTFLTDNKEALKLIAVQVVIKSMKG